MTTITRDEAAKAYANGEEVEVTFVWLDSGDWRNVACYGVFDDPKASFRRKPKPLECWAVVNTRINEVVVAMPTKGRAENYRTGYGVRETKVVHLREVT